MPDTHAMASFKSLTGRSERIKVVDIGANPIDGVPPYQGMLRAGDADVVGFEPNPDALARLEQMKGPAEVYLPHAVGDGARHTLHVCQAPGMTSLLRPNPAVLNRFHGFPGWGTVVATRDVDTVRLDDVAQTAGAELIKIDIQGAELMVFQNATARLQDALVIHTEVEFLPMYIDQPLFGDVDAFLRQHDFVLHRFFPLTSRTVVPLVVEQNIYAGLSQLFWADAIFIRDFTRPDLLSDTQLLRLAAILHDCYQSIDVTLNLLTVYDQRCGTALGSSYLSGLQAGVTG